MICVYAFRPHVLQKYAAAPQGFTEQEETIEILRFLELGIPVKFRKVETHSMSVDTPASLERMRIEFEKRKVTA